MIRKFLLFLFWFPTVVFLCCLGAQEFAFRIGVKSRINHIQGRMSVYLEEFLDDQKTLAELDVFKVNNLGKDAGPFLNPKVRWRPEATSESRQLANQQSQSIALPQPTLDRLTAWENWPEGYDTFDVTSYDLSWMKDLLAYDYWDVYETPGTRSNFEKVKSKKMMMLSYSTEAAFPEIKDFIGAVELSFVKTMKEGHPLDAFREVRHLATLWYSTETLPGALVAITMLRLEKRAYDVFVAQGKIKDTDWQPISADLLARMKGAVGGASEYFSVLAPEDVFKRTFQDGNVKIGLCSAIRFGTGAAASTEGHLYPWLPLERDFRPQFESLKAVAISKTLNCRLHDIRAYWEAPYFEHLHWTKSFSKGGLESYKAGLTHPFVTSTLLSEPIPYLRKGAGLYLAAIGATTNFDWYEKKIR